MRNLSLLTDLYQLTMIYGYFRQGMHETECVFDMFYRRNAEESAFSVMAGLEQVVDYINRLHFGSEEIAYLRSLQLFDEAFLEELSKTRFTGEIYAMPEGSIVFPNEPLVRVRARLFEAQLIETALLNIINHQTLIATKAARVVYAANGDDVIEFGARRAQGPDAANYGARATYIAGVKSTSNVLAGKMFDIPVRGTHAHSWVMSFPTEIDAFRAYANTFPNACLLLVDTFDTLKSGVPNAIVVFEELRAKGYKPMGIRLDSGDLAYLSKEARKMLDAAGMQDVKICASNDLDENLIRELKIQGAKIDIWGVGTKMITGGETSALGGVYKLAAEMQNGSFMPKMKLSENISKMTIPGYKKVFRLYDKDSNKALADLICLEDETVDTSKPLRIFHPFEPWKNKLLDHFTARELLVPIFSEGKQVYELPSLKELSAYCEREMTTIWDEYRRHVNPQTYKVDLSDKLYDLKQNLIQELGRK